MKVIKKTMSALAVALMFLAGSVTTVKAQDGTPKISVGTNLAVASPSLELGVLMNDEFSVHIRGGGLPNFFTAPNKVQYYTIEPFIRWWQDGNTMEGYFIDLGLSGAYFDVLHPSLFGVKKQKSSSDNPQPAKEGEKSVKVGFQGIGLGLMGGAGYSFPLTENLRIVPQVNLALYFFPKYHTYLAKGGEYNRVTDRSILAMLAPTSIGVGFHWVF